MDTDTGRNMIDQLRTAPAAQRERLTDELGSLGLELAPELTAALSDEDRFVRLAAAKALGRLKAASAVPALVAAMGDGGFLMNSQELETAKRLGVGFTTVVFNDNDYGLISWKQGMSRGKTAYTKLGNPDFEMYAASLGIKGYRPKNVGELREQLRTAITSKELCLVEVPIETRVNAELVETLRTYWKD